MDESLKQRVLHLFVVMGEDALDLHTLFEAGGNDRAEREEVVDIVAKLVSDGFLEERGSDYYALTETGREALRRQ
ncbi:MAG TPA: hypothetical protein VJH03_00350 [Blastocatellia bacterium]|nr:hypothetical protein [Blastocatellia bacterium]